LNGNLEKVFVSVQYFHFDRFETNNLTFLTGTFFYCRIFWNISENAKLKLNLLFAVLCVLLDGRGRLSVMKSVNCLW